MSYIGVQAENQVSPAFMREALSPNGSATYFDLLHDVPGYQAENLLVTVNNVIQEPASSYTIINDGNGRPRRLNFGVALATTDSAYVIHRGSGELYHTPPANSVGTAQLESNLKSGRVDQFVGSDGASSNTVFTLSESAGSVNTVAVFINGIYQRPTTNYTVSGSALTFTSSLDNGDQVDVHHHTLRTTITHVADASVDTAQLATDAVTTAKLDTNIAIAGTFGVTGAVTLSSTLAVTGATTLSGTTTITGDLTVNGTTTTINSTTLTVDDKNMELGSVASPTNTTADGGGFTLRGTTNKTILWENDTNQWNINQKWTENAGSSFAHRPTTAALILGY
jgi:hypothetical protein